MGVLYERHILQYSSPLRLLCHFREPTFPQKSKLLCQQGSANKAENYMNIRYRSGIVSNTPEHASSEVVINQTTRIVLYILGI